MPFGYVRRARLAQSEWKVKALEQLLKEKDHQIENRIFAVLDMKEKISDELPRAFKEGLVRVADASPLMLQFHSPEEARAGVHVTVSLTNCKIYLQDAAQENMLDEIEVDFGTDGSLEEAAILKMHDYCGKVLLHHTFAPPTVRYINLTGSIKAVTAAPNLSDKDAVNVV